MGWGSAVISQSDVLSYLDRSGIKQQQYIKTNFIPSLVFNNFNPLNDSFYKIYYHFNNNSVYNENDSLLYDFSGNSSNGYVNLSTFLPFGGYMNDGGFALYNTTNSSIYIPYSPIMNISNFTVSIWIYPYSNESSMSIVSRDVSGTQRAFQFYINPSGTLGLILFNNTANSATFSSNGIAPLNNWSFVSFTWDGTFVKIYINGILNKTGSFNGTLKGSAINRMTIGRMETSTPQFFSGSIDEFSFISKALTETEMLSFYLNYTSSKYIFKGLGVVTSADPWFYDSLIGKNSLKISYNVTKEVSSWWKYNFPSYNMSNFSGIGIWVKGDKSNNTLNWALYNSSSGSFVGNGLFSKFSYKLDFDEWRYLYLDFHYFYDNSTIFGLSQLNNIESIQLNIDNSSTFYNNSNTGTVYFSNLELVDNLLGAECYPGCNISNYGWAYGNSSSGADLWRNMDGLYLQAWLYKNGGTGFTGNKTLLNYSLFGGDMLARTISGQGSWITTQGASGVTWSGNWISLSSCVSLALSYKSLFNEPELNDYIVINNFFNNNSNNNDTRKNHWKNTVLRCANVTKNKDIPSFSVPYAANQFYIAIISEWLAYNISGDNSYLSDFHLKLSNFSGYTDRFGVTPEYDTIDDISPYYDSGYIPIQANIFTLSYFLTKNNTFINLLSGINNISSNLIGFNSKLIFANSSRRIFGDYWLTDEMMTFAVHNISLANNFNYLAQSTYLSIINKSDNYLTSDNSKEYLFPWGFFLPFMYDNYAAATNQSFLFPQQFGFVSYLLYNSSGSYVRSIFDLNVTNSSNFIRAKDEFPFIFYARNQDVTNSWYFPFILAESNSNINYFVWFSSSTSTEKHISSNLSSTINNVVVVAQLADCDHQWSYRSDSGTYTQTWNKGEYDCTDDGDGSFSATFILTGIDSAQNSNILSQGENQYVLQQCILGGSGAMGGFSAFASNFGAVFGIFMLIIIVGGGLFAVSLFYFKDQQGVNYLKEINLQTWIIGISSLLVLALVCSLIVGVLMTVICI
jgi:hypothetical protein